VPIIGKLYDQGIAARGVAAGTDPSAIDIAIKSAAGLEALGKVALLPVILTVVFVLIGLMRKKPAAVAAAAHS